MMDFTTQAQDDDLDINPLDLFCSSIDTLHGTAVDQTVPPDSGWSSRPTKLSGVATAHAPGGGFYGSGGGKDDRELIRRMCRMGIPPALRCSAWIINVVAAANPEMSKSDCDDFGTFRKVRVIGKKIENTLPLSIPGWCPYLEPALLTLCHYVFDAVKDHGWDLTLKSLFPDETDLERAEVLDFGVGHDHLVNIMLHDHGGTIPDEGIRSLTKVLHAARDSLGLEFCPLLPDVTCLLLSYMPESYAYATIRQMVLDDSPFFLAISRVQHLTWCKTFSDLMKRCVV